MRWPTPCRRPHFVAPCCRRTRALLRALDDLRQACEASDLNVADAELRTHAMRRVEERK